jgi:tetratricopeptide (TPR) repeat protein
MKPPPIRYPASQQFPPCSQHLHNLSQSFAVFTVSSVCTASSRYLQFAQHLHGIFSLHSIFTVSSVCTVSSRYLQFAQHLHGIFSLHSIFTVSSVCTVSSRYLQFAQYLHGIFSLHSIFTVSSVCTASSRYLQFAQHLHGIFSLHHGVPALLLQEVQAALPRPHAGHGACQGLHDGHSGSPCLAQRGENLMNSSDIKGALDCFNQGICFNPSVTLFNLRAVCHKQLDMYKKAYFDYSFNIRLEPEVGAHYCNRGLCLSKFKKANLAIEDLILAIKYDPTAAHYYARATIYADFGKNEEDVSGNI